MRKYTPLADKNRIGLTTTVPYDPSENSEFMGELAALFRSRYYTNRGPLVRQFETDLLSYLGNVELNLTTVANATLGLELTLKALGLRGKVLVSPFTFVATVNAIVNAGLEPVFVDINEKTWCLDPEAVERAVNDKVCGVLPVHVYGQPCDLNYFEALREKGIKVVYDSAHAFGVRRNGLPLVAHGDAEVFSFHSTKVMHSGEGGAVASRDAELVARVRLLSNFGIANEFEVKTIGTNAKMSEFHALVGIYCLRALETLIQTRLDLQARYRERLGPLGIFEFPELPDGLRGNGQYFPLLARNDSECEKLYRELRSDGIFVRRYFYPLVNQLEAYKAYAFQKTPVAQSISKRVLCLPLHSYLTAEQQDIVVERIAEVLAPKRGKSRR